MKVLIITGGNIDRDFAFSFLKKYKYDEVIAVDGGLAAADTMQIPVTHLVGDFDTIDEETLERYIHRKDIIVHQYIPEKDYTDTDIAVKLAIDLLKDSDEKQLHILGGTGTRLDHVLANLQMLKRPLDAGVDAMIVDKNNYIRMIRGKYTIKREEAFGKYISLIPITRRIEGLTLKGLKYPLDQASTGFGESLCVSNELLDDEAVIEMQEGLAWLIMSRD